MIEIPKTTFDFLIWTSFRYCIERKTYVVQDFIFNVLKYWESLSPQTKIMLTEEIQAANNAGLIHKLFKDQWDKILTKATT